MAHPSWKGDSMAMTGKRVMPLPAFRFRVEIDLINAQRQVEKLEVGCNECSGLHVETETIEYREGGMNETVHRFATVTRYHAIVLKRG